MTHRIKDDLLYCAKCGDYSPKEDFNKHSSRPDGYAAYCREHEHESQARKGQGSTGQPRPKNPESTKPCPPEIKCYGLCGLMKPVTDFYTTKSEARGYSTMCKECARAYRRADWAKKHPKKPARKDAIGNLFCKECSSYKLPELFGKDRSRSDGRDYICKDCYEKKHPRKTKKRTITDTEALCRGCDKMLPKSSFGSNGKRYIKPRCKECVLGHPIQPKGPPRERYSRYKKDAEDRDLSFNLTVEQFNEIVSKERCLYCGKVGKVGVDRYDNDKGYSTDNCVPCCRICNWMKLNLPVGEFLAHVECIHEHQKLGRLYTSTIFCERYGSPTDDFSKKVPQTSQSPEMSV